MRIRDVASENSQSSKAFYLPIKNISGVK
uniref:Uncharacterized protein n=1 Tax=Arundo donax TaxID=35708 RepID=A0A0A9BJV3_ARUDO